MQKGVKRKKKMENIQAPWIGKPEDEWEDPDEYFNAHGGGKVHKQSNSLQENMLKAGTVGVMRCNVLCQNA